MVSRLNCNIVSYNRPEALLHYARPWAKALSTSVPQPPQVAALTDDDLARFVSLNQKEDSKLAKMMAELGEWQRTIPRSIHQESSRYR